MAQRPIAVLDAHIANRIAAGEVIERPASAVKELMENALDAGARRIEVEIRGGGKEYIRVSDDGAGIPAAEVPLAFERHATSKIRTADDLFVVATLGFRGEALPSIAAVAEVEMRTRTADSLQGTRYVIVAGQPQEAGPVGAPVGTTVIVRRLFFNTPARYKFLRTDATEKRYVADVAARLALARPDVAVRLLADGRELLATPGDGRLMSAALAIYGPQAARELLPVALEAEGIAVEGLVARPTWHHGNRERLTVVLNGRAIQSPAVARAIEKGYDTLLPSRRFPVGVVHITMDPRAVDVNVHPAKAEVRFRDDSLVFRVVLRAVREGLLGANLVAGLAPGEAVPPPVPPAGGGRAPGFQVRESYGPPPRLRQHEPPNAGESPQAHAPLGSQEPAGGQGLSHAQDLGGTDPWATDAEGEDARRQLREMTVLGQLHRTYILGETPAGLWIVDQHVAHERVLYERLLRAAAGGQADVQQLLMPVTITLAPAQAGLAEQFQAELQQVGLILEPFGGRTYLLRGVPVPLAGAGAGELQQLVEEVLAACAAEGAWRPHEVCARLACRAAIKAGQPLEPRQMQQLLADLSQAENPFACPHGRPIVMTVSRSLLARRFGRH